MPFAKPPRMEWLPDPTGRHDYRLWDGEEWDDRVADGGETSEDPISEQPPPPDALQAAEAPSRQRRFAGTLITVLFWFVPYMLGVQSISLDERGDWALAIVFLVAAHVGLIAVAAWTISAWGEGTNPANSLLGLRVADEATGQPLSRGKMLVRALILLWPVIWPVSAAVVLVRKDRKSLADVMLGSIVVDSRHTSDSVRPIAGNG